jgi:nucleotide-binding universal stress UspA family protein
MLLENIEIAPATFTQLSAGFQQHSEPGVDREGTLAVARILVPMDFNKRSIGAAQYVFHLAKRFDAKVTLLHVFGTDPYRGEHSMTRKQRLVQHAVTEVLRTVPSRYVSVLGDPARRIVEHARTERADLILMPTRGRRRWGGLLTDSVTARVMRHAPCPVWTGIENVSAGTHIRNVLCALALAPSSTKVLKWASQLADRFGARLSIVHSSVAFADASGASYFYDLSQARTAWAQQDIAALQRAAGTVADVWLEARSPERGVTAVACRTRADLLVIGRSPRLWLPEKLWTRAYDIVCGTTCPVMVC